MEYSEKQKQILATAERLFSSKGFDGTSVRDIADEAGVNIAMISYYFGSKEKLMEALFEQRTTNIKLRIESLIQDSKLTSLEKMFILADDYIDKVMDKQRFFKIMLCEQVINKNPVIIDLVKDLKKKNVEEINKIIVDGQQKGELKKDIDVVLLLATLTGCLTQVVLTLDHYKEFNHLDELPEEEFSVLIKQKISKHLKTVFKSLLSYEA